MKSFPYIIAVIAAWLAGVLAMQAQNVTVTVTTVQQILPPQAMLYVTNPSDYFNVTLSNNGKDDENVYLVMQVEQINPVSELAVSTPPERQPKQPIIVPANGTRQLAPAEIKNMFNHIPLREISAPMNLFDNYMNGSFALLPEGDYMVHLTAYTWNPGADLHVASAPDGGVAYFKICYKAQAPRFLTPTAGTGLDLETMEIAEDYDPLQPFTWQAPTINCSPTAGNFTYDFRVVELMPGQMPDEVMDGQNVVYQSTHLTSPTATIPQTVVKTLNKEHIYAAQVTAYPVNRDSRMLNYISVENNGKSTFRLFRFKQENKDETASEDTDDDTDDDGDKDDGDKEGDDKEKDDQDKDTEEGEEDWLVLMGNVLHKDSLNNDSLYTFRVPKITEPYFFSMDGARKKYVEASIPVEWEKARFMGGEGLQSDTIQLAYKVQLFNNGERADKQDAVENGLLVYESAEMTDLKDEIMWERLQEQVKAGDYMVLRILPIVKHGHSVAFTGDENIIDFGLSKRASKQYFQCSDMVEIENKTATSKSAADFKGKEVGIGEYQLTIDEISGSAADGFTGKGRVAWEPFGSKIMICVKFEKLRINTDDIVYEGECVTYAAPEMKNADFLDELFSDAGLDNIVADTELPYADKLQGKMDEKLHSLAERYNIKDYCDEVTDSKNIYSLLTTGEVDKVYLPVKLPSELNKRSPVDIQLASMKFTPSNAQMNIVGEAKLPKSDYLNNEILLFGAPRLCMSPNRFLPESGHLALLGDFTIDDPNSAFTITFNAPDNLQTPQNGCYVSWHADEFEDLGLDVDMVIPDLRKDVGGKATDECPKLHASMRIGGWDDFIIDNVTMDPFQHLDTPGYTFTAQDIVVDLSDHRNSSSMGRFPDKYSRSEAGCEEQDEMWHGLYIGDISVQFPSSISIGENGERLKIHGEHMFFDKSGCTLTFGGDSILPPQTTGKMGGWGISLDHANLTIIQNHFENCHFDGRLDIPLFDKVDEKKKDEFGEVAYDCTIRRLTDPRKNAKGERLEKMRYSYVFNTHQIDDLNFNFVVADVTLDKRQTFFLLEAEDNAVADTLDTRVELCLGGDITIGGTEEINEQLGNVKNEKLKAIIDALPLKLKIPGVHFTKMRISNVARDSWVSNDATVLALHKAREEAEKEVKAIAVLAEAKEHQIGDAKCFLNMGEWSLASAQKKIGPFNFKINDYKFDFDQSTDDIKFYVNGGLELCEIVDVSAGITIMSKLKKPEKFYDISGYSLSDGQVKFNDIELGVEVAGVMTFEGKLEIVDEENKKGYGGSITIDVAELFKLDCDGGYYEHRGLTSDEDKEKKAAAEQKAADELKANPASKVTWADFYDNDPSYSWGYFRVNMESSAGLRIDPLVINRISGGFYFNCRPTSGADKEKDKFGGTPEEHFGNIGVALGIGISTSAGEETLKADVDLLVAYDRQAHCLSTFLFNGKLEAVGGMINAGVTLTYLNEKTKTTTEGKISYTSKNRYLCLNVTCEGGIDSKALVDKVTGANEHLASIQEKLNEFQGKLDKVDIRGVVTNPQQSMKQLSGDYEKNPNGEAPDDDDSADDVAEKEGEAKNDPDVTAGKFKVTLEFKVTWAENGKTNTPPKWHLYLGEPAKDKRCTFTYLKFKSSIVSVDIGADGYLCLGNELPDNGALPAIPTKISEFLSGHKQEGTDMGADLNKVERSRAKAAKALLDPTSVKGGVMVGASCWGDISLDLGLIYGSIESMAGFDASLIHYGNNAVCVNSRSAMGKNGWYAMGQLYAYLAAELGVHIKIGKLINEKVELINAGIGGVLEMGLPNPSWVEGQLRVKMSFLGGLFKLNKKFSFSAGDHCVPFVGNALDGFELFQNVSLGSDSLYEALYLPEFAISKADAQKMTFTTNSSLGSHYRLVDPSYSKEMADETGEEAEKLSLHASRTYVFDMNQDLNQNNMKMGVRLFDLGTKPTTLAAGKDKLSPAEFAKQMGAVSSDMETVINNLVKGKSFTDMTQFVVSAFQDRSSTVAETSYKMKGKELTKGREILLDGSKLTSYLESIMDNGSFLSSRPIEMNVSFREDKGTTFHLTGLNNLQPGHSYALVLMGEAYEIDNGKRVWCDYFDEASKKFQRIEWKQSKLWFFRVKTDSEDQIEGDSINDLTPYVALAYPSVDGTKVKSGSEGYTTAYYTDILKPTIALNRDLRTQLPEGDRLNWRLTAYDASKYSEERPDDNLGVQTIKAKYYVNGNCINLEPETRFEVIPTFVNRARTQGNAYDATNELYHLQLLHSYYHTKEKKDSTVALVDLWLTGAPHDVLVGNQYLTDNWLTTTSSGITGKLLPYVEPFVGARPWYEPTIDYAGQESQLTDKQIVYDNSYTFNGKPFRLIDPYLYLAYLSKWTFIGDREVNKYAWDDAYIPFASESLIFERNGTVVNTEFLKGEKTPSLFEFRNKMYSTWNDWFYNNADQPEYPLPVTLGTVGGPTVVNQDMRASTITPLNLNHFSDQRYNMADLVEDFVAAYVVADRMCRQLKLHAGSLFDSFTWCLGDDGVDYEMLDRDILDWNRLHRGQYLEVEYRGTKARVPYYQLPLIFGDCFGSGGAKFEGNSLSNYKRSFSYTIGSKSDVGDDSRWDTEASNLFFFRMLGNEKFGPYTAQAFLRYKAGTNDNCYINSAGTANANQIAWDEFDMTKALNAVSDFRARIYRVDAYDINKGLYVVDGSRGAGPWTEDFTINASSGVAKNMGEMFIQIADYRTYLSTHYDKPQLQAVYTAADKTLTFFYSDDKYTEGSKLNDKTVSYVVSGDDFAQVGWQNSSSRANYDADAYAPYRVETITFDKSFADADIRSTAGWFNDFSILKTVNGLKNLNTSQVTSMHGMFNRCQQLTSLDVSSFDTRNVKYMSSMFAGCSGLTSLDISNFKTDHLESTNYMFNTCSGLKTLTMKTFKALKAKNTEGMFSRCQSLNYLYMNDFSPADVTACASMFKDVPSSVNVYYPYDLDERIKDQIPGKKYELDNPVKAIYATDAQGQKVLLFINSLNTYSTGTTYNIQGKEKTYSSYKVNAVWSASKVLETTSTVPWNSYKSQFVKVIIDPSFKDSPKSLKNWFKDFTSLKTIEGLENLNTKKVTDMSYMFYGCSNLESLDVSHFNAEQVTTMYNMFAGCSSLSDLTFSGLQSKVLENTASMFYGCSKLTSLELYDMQTSNVTDMSMMFAGCSSLKAIAFGYGFDVSKAKTLKQMFEGCSTLESLDRWNPFHADEATDLSYMFSGCKKLNTWLTEMVRRMTTLKATNIKGMFKNCASVTKLDFSNIDTRFVTNMSELFMGCSKLNYIDLSNLTAEKMQYCTDMFNGVPTSSYIFLLANINTAIHPTQVKKATHPNLVLIYPAQVLKVKNGSDYNLVFLCSNNVYVTGSAWNGLSVAEVWSGMDVIKSYREMNNGEISYVPKWVNSSDKTITKVVIDPSFSQAVPLSTAYWFRGMNALTSIEGLEYLNCSNVETMAWMFEDCVSLKEIPSLNRLNTSNVKNMEGMFAGCTNLTTLDLGGFNTSSVARMVSMFSRCESLTALDLSRFDISNLEDAYYMFLGCTSLKDLTMPNGSTTSKVESFGGLFDGCRSLAEVDLSCFKAPKVTSARDMFNGCTSLKKLTLSDTFNVKQTNSSTAFSGVHDLMVYTSAKDIAFMRTDFSAHLGFVEGETGWFYEEGFEDDRPKVAQAIWTEDNSTLTFYYGPLREAGKTFGGMTVTKVWSGSDVTNRQYASDAWRNKTDGIASQVHSVVIDKSFSDVQLTSLNNWFNGFDNVVEIIGLGYVNTSALETMSSLFAGCSKLAKIDFSTFKPSNLKGMAMGSLFSGCSSLKEIDLSTFNTSEVTSMANLFSGCSSLVTVNLSGLNTEKVTAMNGMFADCISLAELNLSSFNTNVETSTTSMFKNCTKLEVLTVGSGFTFNKRISVNNKVFTDAGFVNVQVVPSSSTSTVEQAFVDKLGFVEGTTGQFVQTQAIWTEGNTTLTFLKDRMYRAGDTFNGQTVTNVWYEDDVLSTTGGSNAFWRASDVREKVTKVVFNKSFADVYPKSTRYWFYGFKNLTSITNLTYLNTSEVTNMYQMFYGCTNLPSINVSNFDTRKVTNMQYMFGTCSSLTSLNLSNFDTSSLTSCNGMFYNCSKLSSLDLSRFNTSQFTGVSSLFYNCSSLKTLTLGTGSTFDKVSSASNVFYNVSDLNVVLAQPSQMAGVKSAMTDKLGFVVGTHGRFVEPGTEVAQAIWTAGNTTLTFVLTYPYKAGDTYNGQKITNVWSGDAVAKSPLNNVPAWSTTIRDKVTKVVFEPSFVSVSPTSMSYWFYYCTKLTTFTGMSYLNTKKVTDMKALFYNCPSLKSITLSYFNTSSVTTMAYMFRDCTGLTSLNVSKFDTKNVTSMLGMFYNCSGLTSLNVSNFNTEEVTNMSGMFFYCKGLTSLSLSNFNTSQVSSMKEMFASCSGLTTMNLSNFSTYNVTDMSKMFSYCSNLTSVTIGQSSGYLYKARKLSNTSSMFEGCTKLRSMYFYQTSGSCTTTSKMFYECNELTDVELSLSPTDDASYSFYHCYKLKQGAYRNLPINPCGAKDVFHFFDGCKAITSLLLGDFSTTTRWSYMFNGCTGLTSLTFNNTFNPQNASSQTSVFGGIKGDQIAVTINLLSSEEYKRTTLKEKLKTLGFKEGVTGHFTK